MLANFETPSRAKMLKIWGRRSSFNVQKVMWLTGVFWGFYRTPEDKRNWGAIRASLARCIGHFEHFN
jgi:hypothetical protein